MFRFARAHPTRIRLFDNRWLELTTLTPLPLFLAVWLPATALSIMSAFQSNAVMTALACVIAGAAIWFVFEYLAHRYVFHMNLNSRLGRYMIFVIHGNHHADPADPLRSIMSLSVSVPLGVLIWYVCTSVGGAHGKGIAAGFITGYFLYDLTHWSCHQARAKNRLTQALRRHHLLHHYAHRDGNYGMTLPFMDRVFKTKIQRR